MKIETKIDRYLLTDNYIECHTLEEVQHVINVLRASNIINLAYTHSDSQYIGYINRKGKVFLYLHGNSQLWIAAPRSAEGEAVNMDYFINNYLY